MRHNQTAARPGSLIKNALCALQVEVALDFARGMAYLHSRRQPICHRDLVRQHLSLCIPKFLCSRHPPFHSHIGFPMLTSTQDSPCSLPPKIPMLTSTQDSLCLECCVRLGMCVRLNFTSSLLSGGDVLSLNPNHSHRETQLAFSPGKAVRSFTDKSPRSPHRVTICNKVLLHEDYRSWPLLM